MTQLVQLFLTQSDQGIQAQVSVTDSPLGSIYISGKLPPYEDVLTAYHTWRSTYLELRQLDGTEKDHPNQGDGSRAIVVDSVGEYSVLGGHYTSSPEVCDQKANTFKIKFNRWLQSSDFVKARELLSKLFSQQIGTRFVICTDNNKLQQLPWVLWDLLQEYPAIEVAISGLNFRQRP
ncbi:MAG: hypothetical protein AAFY17_17400, partial [Cyanobacteria bacterium J06642_11]